MVGGARRCLSEAATGRKTAVRKNIKIAAVLAGVGAVMTIGAGTASALAVTPIPGCTEIALAAGETVAVANAHVLAPVLDAALPDFTWTPAGGAGTPFGRPSIGRPRGSAASVPTCTGRCRPRRGSCSNTEFDADVPSGRRRCRPAAAGWRRRPPRSTWGLSRLRRAWAVRQAVCHPRSCETDSAGGLSVPRSRCPVRRAGVLRAALDGRGGRVSLRAVVSAAEWSTRVTATATRESDLDMV